MTSSPAKKCFTIMPFTVGETDLERYHSDKNHWIEVYTGLIAPAVEKSGLICERDDEDSSSRLITESIWRKIEEADVVLCDLSASNPNVYLELGWALRADKRFVLIKDDLTRRYFDLNQYYTYEYPHRLQPSSLKRAVDDLAEIILKTLSDNRKQYSIVNRMSLQVQAVEAMRGGNVEVGLLKELLNEMRAMKRSSISNQQYSVSPPPLHKNIKSQADLARLLPGTTWIKKNGIELVRFQDESMFHYKRQDNPQWEGNTYKLGERLGQMTLLWHGDGFRAECEFFEGFTKFIEESNLECIWTLISE